MTGVTRRAWGWGAGLAVAGLWLAGVTPADAQSSHETVSLAEDTITAGGGVVGGGNPMRIVTGLGESAGGRLDNGIITLQLGYPSARLTLPLGERRIAVEGTVDDPDAAVTVNGVPARVRGRQFRAEEIGLAEGANRLTAVAVDAAGNVATASVTVTVDTRPPARPTLEEAGLGRRPVDLAIEVPASTYLSPAAHLTLTGTKTAGTSIWISVEGGSASGGNARELVPLNEETTWTAPLELTEGDNDLLITTKDAAGNESTSVHPTVVVDGQAPVISPLRYLDPSGAPLALDPSTGVPTTNFDRMQLQGEVDDRLTAVTVDGALASHAHRTFTAEVSLAEGPHQFTITALSPNGHRATATPSVMRGARPTLTSVEPADRAKRYMDQTLVMEVDAVDAQGDALQYQFLLDGQVVRNWAESPETTWTPTASQAGPHTVEVRAKDAFGGFTSKTVRVLVIRRPIEHP